MSATSFLAALLWTWLFAAFLLFRITFRRAHDGIGMPLAYAANLALIHWFGAVVFLWSSNDAVAEAQTTAGFAMTTVALFAFVAGCWASGKVRRAESAPGSGSQNRDDPTDKGFAAAMLIAVGAIAYLLGLTPLASVPTFGAFVTTSSNLMAVGLCLAVWVAWYRRRLFWPVLLCALLFPPLTLLTQGFIGYGVVMLLTVCTFVATFYKPRAHLLLLGCAAVYLGLSVFATYMQQRAALRTVIWGEQSYETRVSVAQEALSRFELFDPGQHEHVEAITMRLNQNILVGKAIQQYESTGIRAYGETIVLAFYALVPRVIWPDRPAVAGSMGLARKYTDLEFDDTTSVGLGHVMELYINFGTPAVLVGCFVMGFAVRTIDRSAARALFAGDTARFAGIFLVALPFLDVGGSLIELFSGVLTASVVWAVLSFYRERLSRRRATPRGAMPYRHSNL
jgi:hypothetical protein